jgi:hypothetical protein
MTEFTGISKNRSFDEALKDALSQVSQSLGTRYSLFFGVQDKSWASK